MCELLGISANVPVDMALSFQEFRLRSRIHSHGYGFAYRQKDRFEIMKNSQQLLGDHEATEITRARSDLFIGHVRYASVGSINKQNTHPFVAQRHGKHWAFAHNGTVSAVKQLGISTTCDGTTDSEHAFHWLLDQLDGIEENTTDQLYEAAARIKQYGNFNFILSDGLRLWAHADNSLWMLERSGPFDDGKARLRDADKTVNLADYKRSHEHALLIATMPLTDERWRKLAAGTIIEITQGYVSDKRPGDDRRQISNGRQVL